MKPLISVIVPVYNVEDFVGKCLESIAGQSYENLDIVIVDDGSTDGSGRICDEFVKNEKRARVFHKENGGLSSARNFGIKKARGKWLSFVDSDDWVREEFLGELQQAMRRTRADVAVCGYDRIKPERKVMSGEVATIQLLTKQENLDIVAWNKLYKKELFIENKIWFPDGEKYEDTLTTYKVLAAARRVVYLDVPLYCYTERAGSIMQTSKLLERLQMRERAAKEAIDYFKGDQELEDAAKIALLLAKYAFLDFSMSHKIDKKYGVEAKEWIREHARDVQDNRFLSWKLKVYGILLKLGLYEGFRKMWHE